VVLGLALIILQHLRTLLIISVLDRLCNHEEGCYLAWWEVETFRYHTRTPSQDLVRWSKDRRIKLTDGFDGSIRREFVQ
ncbi:MAG: hypothetical protein EZS28_048965, partial [Streblomastix strix]